MTASRLTTTTASSPGIDLDLSRVLASVRRTMREGGLQTPLSLALRTRLQQRAAVLDGSAASAAPTQTKLEIAKLTTAFPSLRGTGAADAQAMVAQYATALQGLPLWAIREVCGEIVRGTVPGLNPDFPPTAPRVRQLVDERTTRSELEAKQIREVLEAPVVPKDNPEMAEKTRKVIGEGLRNLVEVMREKDRQFAGGAAPEKPPFKPFSIAECAEMYKRGDRPGMPFRNVTRNDDRNVTDAADIDISAEAGLSDLEQRVGS